MVNLVCLISQQSQVQEGNHPSMWAISLGRPAIKIAHFERMGLDGFSFNSLILTRECACLLSHFCSLFVYPPIFHSYFILFYFFISCFSSPFSILLYSTLFYSILLPPPLLCTAEALFILPAVTSFYYFSH